MPAGLNGGHEVRLLGHPPQRAEVGEGDAAARPRRSPRRARRAPASPTVRAPVIRSAPGRDPETRAWATTSAMTLAGPPAAPSVSPPSVAGSNRRRRRRGRPVGGSARRAGRCGAAAAAAASPCRPAAAQNTNERGRQHRQPVGDEHPQPAAQAALSGNRQVGERDGRPPIETRADVLGNHVGRRRGAAFGVGQHDERAVGGGLEPDLRRVPGDVARMRQLTAAREEPRERDAAVAVADRGQPLWIAGWRARGRRDGSRSGCRLASSHVRRSGAVDIQGAGAQDAVADVPRPNVGRCSRSWPAISRRR